MDKLIEQIQRDEYRIQKLRAKLMEQEKELFPAKVYDQTITDKWSMYQGDCIEVVSGLPNNSIHYSIFSPPFLSLYV